MDLPTPTFRPVGPVPVGGRQRPGRHGRGCRGDRSRPGPGVAGGVRRSVAGRDAGRAGARRARRGLARGRGATSDRRASVLVALAGGHVVGFVAIGPSEGAPAGRRGGAALIVAPDAQRAGHGRDCSTRAPTGCVRTGSTRWWCGCSATTCAARSWPARASLPTAPIGPCEMTPTGPLPSVRCGWWPPSRLRMSTKTTASQQGSSFGDPAGPGGPAGLSVGIATGAYGVSFGALAVAAGRRSCRPARCPSCCSAAARSSPSSASSAPVVRAWLRSRRRRCSGCATASTGCS